MKTIKTDEGLVFFYLTKEEIIEIKKILNDDLVLTSHMEDPLKGFHKNTVAFFRELNNYFGNQKISGKDPKLIELKKKYYVVDIVQRLRKLAAKGYCEYEMKQYPGYSLLDWFKLNF